jgi:hydrogenase nickel incorporation protein HypA/HybF
MHELTLAVNIVEIAESEARQAGSLRIHEVLIEAGILSGVDPEALKTALDIASKNTILESAGFVIQQEQGAGICSQCGKEFPMDSLYTYCNECRAPANRILKGTGLRVVSIRID